jgi:hypothetical protein
MPRTELGPEGCGQAVCATLNGKSRLFKTIRETLVGVDLLKAQLRVSPQVV